MPDSIHLSFTILFVTTTLTSFISIFRIFQPRAVTYSVTGLGATSNSLPFLRRHRQFIGILRLDREEAFTFATAFDIAPSPQSIHGARHLLGFPGTAPDPDFFESPVCPEHRARVMAYGPTQRPGLGLSRRQYPHSLLLPDAKPKRRPLVGSILCAGEARAQQQAEDQGC